MIKSNAANGSVNSPNANQFKSKRERVKQACEQCQRKKSKCNGQCPCSNCASKNNTCVYSSNFKGRRGRAKTVKSNAASNPKPCSLQTLCERLSNLENILIKLSNQVECKAYKQYGPSRYHKDGYSNSTTYDLTLSSRSSCPRNDEPVVGEQDSDNQSHHFGIQSLFCLFSAKSLLWMKKRLKNSGNLIEPFRNIQISLNQSINSSIKKWVELPVQFSVKIKEDNNFPIDSAIIFEILECFYEEIYYANYICDINLIRELFQVYYCGKMNLTLRKLRYSELLIMNVSICLCLSRVISNFDRYRTSDDKYKNLRLLSIEDLTKLSNKCFDYSIYYYDKISTIGEGILTLQGILLLMMYNEVNHSTNLHINYMLGSMLISSAQELSLYRFEKFINLSEEEAEIRRRLWWFCQYIDIELCYRTGVNPLITSNNTTTLAEEDIYFISVPIEPFQDLRYLKNHSNLLASCRIKGFQNYYCYYLLMLNRIRYKSYDNLFSLKSRSYSKETMLNNVKDLNDDMFKLIDLIEPEIKPKFYYDNEKVQSDNKLFESIYDANSDFYIVNNLIFQLTFFSHLLIINRAPFIIISDHHNDVQSLKSLKLSLDSARTILHLVLNTDNRIFSKSSLNWTIYYPFIAYVSLMAHCLECSSIYDFHDDCLILIKASMKLFKFNSHQYRDQKAIEHKLGLLDLTARILLECLLDIAEKDLDFNFHNQIDGLADHLDSCKQIYPELFNNCSHELLPVPNSPLPCNNGLASNQMVNHLNCRETTNTEAKRVEPILSNLLNWSNETIKENDESLSSLLHAHIYKLPNFFFENKE